ncbi:hypothetical protein ANCCAN_13438 [Ancylostoma caninum]|uniref:Uncharacterized protein n=1 Tax=Ancylostoma caninum TaxID=29170 RepID=A0A368GBG3_ANCCA|nr:hypothetical protein ANCCAN_13438 [Ancylostoma caninum]
MSGILLLAAVLCSILAAAVDAQAQILYAVDLTEPLSEFDARCMKISQYSTVFLRAYAPSAIDGFESHVCQSIWNAQKAGLGVEVFMTPTRPSYQNGAEQFNQLYQGLQGCKINAKTVWLQVISPAEWGLSPRASIDFINQVLSQASHARFRIPFKVYSVAVGIYTSQEEWMRITSGIRTLQSPTMLW